MLSALSPTLQSLRQRDFYSQPRFHVSIAWALLDPDISVNGDVTAEGRAGTYDSPISVQGTLGNSFFGSGGNGESESQAERFPHIPRFPSELIPTLHQRFGSRLSSKHTGEFDAETIAVKIGKDIFSWPLRGTHVH
jgi:hypothetical protein